MTPVGPEQAVRARARAREVAIFATLIAALWVGAATAAPVKTSPKNSVSAAALPATRIAAPAASVPKRAAKDGGADSVIATRMVDLSFALDSVRVASGVPAIAAAVVERGRVVAAG